ncbi:MAG: glycosyltransferase [Bacteroidota bacterium]
MHISTDTTEGIIKVKAPQKHEIWIIRTLICFGLASMLIFLFWFVHPEHVGYAPVYWLLTFALLFKLVKMIHEWYHYWSPSIPVMPVSNRQWTVDILTTACPGEPREMIINTLKAMKKISYPHTDYLCDEGDDPILKDVCKELGVIHITRIEKINAKAGNINNGLKHATGEICVVLDPDHIPVPEFLDRVLPYFQDEKIGFVQCVQAYGNQQESFIARGAAEQTYHFYGPMMMCMNSYGTVQAIGANCTFRREALDSIGGHAAGLSEDMHTAMQLHAKGWKSVYVPEVLTRGLVPGTLSAYYKQQLKWSRGTFELLFRTFPQLSKKFTWRQKIHYFTIPLYFLFGLINLIDVAIPLLALGLAQVPWEVNLVQFGMYFFPLCAISMIVRLYAQRWLLEKHERGFHFAGGILRTATWWIFLVGFVYTIFKINVPYIPTPKEDEHQNYVRLSIPNIIIFLLSIVLVYYGLSIDWTPYSIAMASYSIITISMLGFTVFMSQQKFLMTLDNIYNRIPAVHSIVDKIASLFITSQQVVYQVFKHGPVVLLVAISLVLFSYSSLDDSNVPEYKEKELGGFYVGTTLAEGAEKIEKVNELERNVGTSLNVISFSQQWNNDSVPFATDLMEAIRSHGSVPYISWTPINFKDSSARICSDIEKGLYDTYLNKCAVFFRNYKDPVFITFTINTAQTEGYAAVKSWQYLYSFFNNLGVSNLTWVWCPSNASEIAYYPGEKFVDWIGVNCMNYSKDVKAKDWYSFSDIYNPYRNTFGNFKKPVMITSVGCAGSAFQAGWYKNALDDIQNKYHEVKSIIVYNDLKKIVTIKDTDTSLYIADFNCNNSTNQVVGKQLQHETFNKYFVNRSINYFNEADSNYTSSFVKGKPGTFQLLINNQPYYIRGIAYNTAHDWRDGNMPLTRRQVENDFKKIKEMGANTIRRYGTGIYDRNVLNIAEEYNLNVLYGFWFDPKIDFYLDSGKVTEYMEEVEEKVLQYKDHSSVIAWSLGNESWGLLKHSYAKPYLIKVRNAYVQMIEHLAQRIHELDPSRPVFSCIEHEEYQLPGELVAFHDGAPSIDVIGVNSYYKEQISTLNHIVWQFDPSRPYLVSEFGPNGYWDPKYNKANNNSVIEESDTEKAKWYREQWVSYVNGYKGYNVGGFAYCWHDRMEGSYTWFGLTDFKGRPKPSYYALKEQWTNLSQEALPQFSISGPSDPKPGDEYSYTATGNNKSNLNFEWKLLKDEYLEQVDNIDITDNNAVALVKIPEVPSDYRLYLFVTDKDNQWVTTSSVPIKVRQKLPQ